MSAIPQPIESDAIYSLEEFMQMDFDERVELVDGKIQTMGWNNLTHARLVTFLSALLDSWAKQTNWGLIFSGDAGILTKKQPDNARGADLICISRERYQKVSQKGKVMDLGPELIIEVVSPSNTWNAINEKLKEYFAIQTGEVWVVSPENRMVTVFDSLKTSRSFTAEDDDVVQSDALPGFELKLSEMSAEIDSVL